jgi:tetratricopeptide (TPR) repeat protein
VSAKFHLVSTCFDEQRIARVASGTADPEVRTEVLRHAVECADCRTALLALSLADNPGTPEEEALVARALERPARPIPLPLPAPIPLPRRRWALRATAAAAAVACAAALAVMVITRTGSPDAEVLALASDTRPVEGRLSLGLPHAPYRPKRGVGDAVHPLDGTLARLLALKRHDPEAAARPLAALYLARGEPGDLGRAEAALASGTPGPELDNDRAVVLLAQGRAEEALAAVRSALVRRPDYAPAHFNEALALAALGRRIEAAHALRDYLGTSDVVGAEKPWIQEARERLVELERADR